MFWGKQIVTLSNNGLPIWKVGSGAAKPFTSTNAGGM